MDFELKKVDFWPSSDLKKNNTNGIKKAIKKIRPSSDLKKNNTNGIKKVIKKIRRKSKCLISSIRNPKDEIGDIKKLFVSNSDQNEFDKATNTNFIILSANVK
ncbi:hypothetical protein Glove_144g104 [Diversispora epigaea]|uniref:Uncharacterized protein n=1 Tax=Diversispora epigaea TaxID=1348612 RepID=A0A397IYK0_9GLOM|nr:hypothetical protein Glove_144g104 [Diversispora epigaea]